MYANSGKKAFGLRNYQPVTFHRQARLSVYFLPCCDTTAFSSFAALLERSLPKLCKCSLPSSTEDEGLLKACKAYSVNQSWIVALSKHLVKSASRNQGCFEITSYCQYKSSKAEGSAQRDQNLHFRHSDPHIWCRLCQLMNWTLAEHYAKVKCGLCLHESREQWCHIQKNVCARSGF